MILLVLPGLALQTLPGRWWIGPAFIALLSLVSYAMYAHDKKQAVPIGLEGVGECLALGGVVGWLAGCLSCPAQIATQVFQAILPVHILVHCRTVPARLGRHDLRAPD